MGVENGKPIGVVERQNKCRPVVGLEIEVVRDRLRIGFYAAFRKAHETRFSGAPGSRQQDSEVGIDLPASCLAFDQTPSAINHPEGIVGLEIGFELFQPCGIAWRNQRNRMAGLKGGKVGDNRMLGICGLHRDQFSAWAEALRSFADAPRELCIAYWRTAGKDKRRRLAMGAQVVE
jgi:hypothetical protein